MGTQLTHAEHGKINDALGIPDVSAILVEGQSAQELVEFVAFLESQRSQAFAKFATVCAPVDEALAKARAAIQGEIQKNGGTALPHDTFEVRLEQKVERDKRIDILRGLEEFLPAEEYAQAVYSETHTVWKADLRKCDKFAKQYGGKVAEIVADGSCRVEIGAPRLVIEPRKSALKKAGAA